MDNTSFVLYSSIAFPGLYLSAFLIIKEVSSLCL